ncbi:HAD-like domain-containing protein [Chytriomyces cf. hyalinus JEL632]|nr:HAD-like domain-containing protein [Chytriomyces cf. hyalinus JEL632]
MSIHLLAIDLDGTTLNQRGTVSARTKNTLAQVAATGAVIALCSGRSNTTMAPAKQSIGLETLQVAFNGSLGIGIHGETLFKETLAQDQVAAVLKVAEQLGAVVNYYGESVIYAAPTTDEHIILINKLRAKVGAEFVFISDYSTLPMATPKLMILDVHVDKVVAALNAQLGDSGLHFVPDDYFVECLPANVNKGVGFAKLCKLAGIQLENTVAFGDGINDIEFLQTAGLGIAMANAKLELKKVAKRVTQFSNDEDGLAIELEALLAQGMFGPPPTHAVEL